jgi:ABC-2 type transport system ATP-binding protein
VIIARVDGDAEAALRAVRDVPGVTSVDVHNRDEITVAAPDGAAVVSPVAVALSTSGVKVKDLTLRTTTLDDVFLELTGNRIAITEDEQ